MTRTVYVKETDSTALVRAETQIPAAQGQSSGRICPAVSDPDQISFVAAAPPVVAESFNVTEPAVMHTTFASTPGAFFNTPVAFT
jgi:hypothetical protein